MYKSAQNTLFRGGGRRLAGSCSSICFHPEIPRQQDTESCVEIFSRELQMITSCLEDQEEKKNSAGWIFIHSLVCFSWRVKRPGLLFYPLLLSQKDVWLKMDEGPVTQDAAKHYETLVSLSLESSLCV